MTAPQRLIEKLLRVSVDPGATSAERRSAKARARRIATKSGLTVTVAHAGHRTAVTPKRAYGTGSLHWHSGKQLWRGYVSLGGGRRRYVSGVNRADVARRLDAAIAERDAAATVGS